MARVGREQVYRPVPCSVDQNRFPVAELPEEQTLLTEKVTFSSYTTYFHQGFVKNSYEVFTGNSKFHTGRSVRDVNLAS